MGGVSLNVGSQAIGDSKNIDYLNKQNKCSELHD